MEKNNQYKVTNATEMYAVTLMSIKKDAWIIMNGVNKTLHIRECCKNENEQSIFYDVYRHKSVPKNMKQRAELR